MIESLRAFGYNLQTAIADIIDNSISAKAEKIWLTFHWNGSDSYISIEDNGKGMTETELVNAMRPSSQSPMEIRKPDDLGRFGLGLKTASFSQCRKLTVRSKASGYSVATRQWNLDYVTQTGEWRLLKSFTAETLSKLSDFRENSQGTIVLWEHLDQIVGSTRVDDQKAHNRFLELIEVVERHLAMVFHRFLERHNQLRLWINDAPVEPWNPFLPNEKATQNLPEERFQIEEDSLLIKPYVLPHHSKISQQTYNKAAGPDGWNAQQGFYVYRNERLLVAGDWLGLGFQKEEHHKLARIEVNLTNSMDSDWNIDVKKSRARPPAFLRSDLKRIARLTRQKAMEIYRHRGKVVATTAAEEYIFPWERRVKHGKIFYLINQEHPLIKEALRIDGEFQQVIRALIRLLEETVPVQRIWLDSSVEPEKHSQPFEGDPPEEIVEVMRQVYQAMIKNGLKPEDARSRLVKMEPFQRFEELVNSFGKNLDKGDL
ncbi:ATP-binding protein [Oscillatoria sp. FACHB-1407]|nr:ATP-binding protein [Oscillatoria sp. FACHB-1407]